jgi:hypothetical protein
MLTVAICAPLSSDNVTLSIPARAMTSIKQIEANRLNAKKSTGPRTDEGKHRSRENAVRHGLTSATVITSLENVADYEIFEATLYAEYQPRTATSRELVARLTSILWRLRRSTSIETGLMQIQGELMRSRNSRKSRRKMLPLPQWYDEMDIAAANTSDGHISSACQIDEAGGAPDGQQDLAYCFLQASRLQFGVFDTLTRYETALWRQVAQMILMLQSAGLGRQS